MLSGVAGMLETLWALGRQLAWQGVATPFILRRHASEYPSLAKAKAAVLAVGVAGYGNVARGARKILDLLPAEPIEPQGSS